MPGLLLRFDFGDATHDLSYEDIKGAFRPVAFVEFQKVGGAPGLALHTALLCLPGTFPVAYCICYILDAMLLPWYRTFYETLVLLVRSSFCIQIFAILFKPAHTLWQMGMVWSLQGGSSGILRFRNKEDADQGLGKADAEGKVSIQDVTAAVTKLEGKARLLSALCYAGLQYKVPLGPSGSPG